jgi:hypothetical protein
LKDESLLFTLFNTAQEVIGAHRYPEGENEKKDIIDQPYLPETTIIAFGQQSSQDYSHKEMAYGRKKPPETYYPRFIRKSQCRHIILRLSGSFDTSAFSL